MQGLWFSVLCLCASSTAAHQKVSPIEKVLQLLGELEAKIIKDGEGEQAIYEEFGKWCSDTSKETQFAIKTAKSDGERFSAAVDEASAEISGLETKIDELTGSIAGNEKDLADATKLRETEHADFLASDKDMAETVSMLSRAIAIIEKEMSGGASLLQQDSMSKVMGALSALVNAAPINALDKARVEALMQTDDMQPAGAPQAAAYENQSGGILTTLEDMLEKAQAQASEGQKAEMTAAHNYAMLKQGLEDSVANENKELAASKKGKASAEEKKAEATGELERVNKERAEDEKKLKDTQHECMTKAEEYELSQKERGEELEALATAKKILQEKTGGAADRAYSFVQIKTASKAQARADVVGSRVVAMLQQVAKEQKAREFAQLAVKVRAAMMTGADPFAKVKGMLQEMVEKLIAEAKAEAEKKAFCDKEMSETKAKKEDKQEEVDDLNTKIDKFTSKIAKLTQGVARLEEELANIASEQKTADEMRAEEKAAWGAAKADFEGGLEGVQMALQVLRDYYAAKDDSADAALLQGDVNAQMSLAQKETGSATGIIGMLEVAESDFSKMLAEGNAAEDQSQSEYDTFTQDNKITRTEKETEVKYMNKDKAETEAMLADTKDDLGVSQEELDAILEYWAKLQPQCVAKPEPYEERKKRREAEIQGLKQALEILETESAGASFLAMRRA